MDQNPTQQRILVNGFMVLQIDSATVTTTSMHPRPGTPTQGAVYATYNEAADRAIAINEAKAERLLQINQSIENHTFKDKTAADLQLAVDQHLGILS